MRYISKMKEPRFVIRPTDRIIDEHRRLQIVPGLRAEFVNHQFETNDPILIDALHNHPKRGKEFDEVFEKEIELVKKVLEPTKMAVGSNTSTNNRTMKVEEEAPIEVATRPTDTVAISPELVRAIDERVQAALGTIVDLLNKQTVKEEKVMGTEKPKKTFKCPYCGDTNFDSPFKLGDHKKSCPKRVK